MQSIQKLTIMVAAFGLMAISPAWAMDAHDADPIQDGNWIYFNPASSEDGTTVQRRPMKRSLPSSIRRDALRHYEMPHFEMAESGQVISFYGESDPRSEEEAPFIVRGGSRSVVESQGDVFELPESGQTIVFPKEDIAADQVSAFDDVGDSHSGEEATVVFRGRIRSATASQGDVFELPESGQTIVFQKEGTAADSDDTLLARQGDDPF